MMVMGLNLIFNLVFHENCTESVQLKTMMLLVLAMGFITEQ